MKKINLQLFAYDPYELTDYLDSIGESSNWDDVERIAKRLGYTNYTGSDRENEEILNRLKGIDTTTQPKTTTSGGAATTQPKSTTNGGVKSNIAGVDNTTQNAMNSTFEPSSNVTNAQNDASNYLGNLQNIPSFSASSSYQQAMEYTNSLLQQLSTGKTSYSDQIKEMMNKIQNREDFEYDVDKDMLFQQYLGSAMNTGKQAMQNTIGQASALTGGYGSTYATSAGNQMYNAYIQDAYNNLPEYYQMALEAYQMEGDEMYKQLSMLNQADETEYSRQYNAWNANFSNANAMYERELAEWQNNFDQAFKTFDATQGYAQTLYANEYNKWADEVANTYKYAQMLNADYWNQKDDAYRNMTFLADNDVNADGKFDALDQAMINQQKTSSGGKTGTFSVTEINAIIDAYRDAGGGEAGNKAVDSLLKGIGKYQDTEEFNALIDSYISSAEAEKGLPVWYQTWNMDNDTKNHGLGEDKGYDRDDMYVNLNGEHMTFIDLKRAIEKSGLSEAKQKEFLDDLIAKSKQ